MPDLLLISNSRLDTWKDCERKYYFQYEQRWMRNGIPSPALAFGSAWGKAMDYLWETANKNKKMKAADLQNGALSAFSESWTEEGMPDAEELFELFSEGDKRFAARNLVVADKMLAAYIPKRLPLIRRVEILEIEEPFVIPLDPHNPYLLFAGKMDKVYRDPMNGGVYGLDHKTTSGYRKGGPFSWNFLNGFNPNSQIDGYQFYLRFKYGKEARYIYIDAALVHTSVRAFELISVNRPLSQIERWMKDTQAYVRRILSARDPVRKDTGEYLANTRTCHTYSGCPYLDICAAVSEPTALKHVPEGYEVSERTTADFLGIDEKALKQKIEEATA